MIFKYILSSVRRTSRLFSFVSHGTMRLSTFVILGTSLFLAFSLISLFSAFTPPVRSSRYSRPPSDYSYSVPSNYSFHCSVNITQSTYCTPVELLPCAPQPSSHIVHALVTFASWDEFELIRSWVGHIHYWEWKRPIGIFTSGMSEDQLGELRLFRFVTVFVVEGETSKEKIRLTSELLEIHSLIHSLARAQYDFYLFVPLHYFLARRLCAIDEAASSGKIVSLLQDCLSYRGENHICFPMQDFFATYLSPSPIQPGPCWLQMRTVIPSPSPNPPRRTPGKKLWCMALATYTSPGIGPFGQSLLSVFTKFFPTSIIDDLERFDFAVYVATQVDPLWDNPEHRSTLLAAMRSSFDIYNISLHVFRYPLNPGLVDIAWKFNQLILQAYADGCDYIYQWSDDAKIRTPRWASAHADFLDSHEGFGTVGMMDDVNEATMTLGACGRAHIEINGWFWPPRLKNWYADNFVSSGRREMLLFLTREIQRVYGEYSQHQKEFAFLNTQVHGMRYRPCDHEHVFLEELGRARQRAIKWWLKKTGNHSVEVQTLRKLLEEGLLTLQLQSNNLNELPDPDCPGKSPISFDSLSQLEEDIDY